MAKANIGKAAQVTSEGFPSWRVQVRSLGPRVVADGVDVGVCDEFFISVVLSTDQEDNFVVSGQAVTKNMRVGKSSQDRRDVFDC